MTARDLLVYSGLASFAVTCVLGAFVFLKNRQNPTNVFFGVFALSIGIWSIGSSLENVIADEDSALVILRTCYLPGVFLPALFLHFAYYLTGRIHTDRKFLILAYSLSTVFAASVYTRFFIDGFQIIQPYHFRLSNPGPMYYAFLTYFFLLILYVLVVIYAESRKCTGLKSHQMRYIFYAHVVAATAGLDYFLSVLQVIPYPPLDDYLLVFYFGVFAYGIARYHLMDITVVLHKGITYALLLAAVLGPVFLAVAVSQRATVHAIPPLLAASVVFCCGLWIALKNPRNPVNLPFALLCAGVCVWLFSMFMVYSAHQEAEAVIWGKTAYIGVVFSPALFYHFCVRLLKRSGEQSRILGNYAISTAFLVLIPTDYLTSGSYVHEWGVYPRAGPFHPLFLGYFTIVSGYSLLRLHRGYKTMEAVSPSEAARLKYMLWACAIGLLAAVDFAQAYGAEFYPIGFVFVGLWISLGMYAMVAYQPREGSWRPGTEVLSYTQALALIPSYFAILGVVWAFTGTPYYILAGVLLALLAGLAELVVNVRKGMEDVVGKALFPQQHNAYDALNDFSTAMMSILDLKALTERTIAILARALGSSKISLYLLDKEKDEYILKAAQGVDESRLREVTLTSNHLLPQYLQEMGQAILKEELENRGKKFGAFSKGIIRTLEQLECELCLPLQNQGRVTGFVNLGPKPNRAMFTREDLKNLSILAASAASAFANAAFHEQEKKEQRREKQDERAHAFETIAGGFAHEIRNPLVSINTFLELVPLRKDDAEFMEEFRKVVMHDSARIERLSGEVLGFARLHEPQREKESLNDVVVSSLRAIEFRAQSQGVALTTELAAELPTVWIDSQQMRQVLTNLNINALDAMETLGGGRLITRTRRLVKSDGVWVQIEITDSGCGMPADTLEKIFVPFFTTKHESKEREGTGLGLPISQRIIVAHGGYIEVKSEVGEGTTFSVNLPVRVPRDSQP
jgi:signal transduction histidine kinase